MRVRGRLQAPVVIIGTTAPPSDNFVELLLLIDAISQFGMGPCTVVIPYFGYARADRITFPGESISARAIAGAFRNNTVRRVIGVDFHSAEVTNFFTVPFMHLSAQECLIKEISKYINLANTVIVAPDHGAYALARRMGTILRCRTAWLEKKRPRHDQAVAGRLHGAVQGRDVVLVDDMIDTAGTMIAAISSLKACGAKRIIVAATHGILSGDASHRLQKAGIDRIILTDSVAGLKTSAVKNLSVVSIVPLIGDVLARQD